MFQKFKNHTVQNFPYLVTKKLLLAVSGGLDSMVLLHLFQKLNYDIAVAHCNFQLRGLESFNDQKFIENYADLNQITLYSTHFDTLNFAKDYKLSTQVAARELRYDWFQELAATHHFDYILTAHHADDNLETFIINLSRGTGLNGLIGIPQENDKILRPMLPFSRLEIEDYAKQNNLIWREDSSNISDKYLRNKIRHHLIPILKDLNPDFLTAFQKTQSYLNDAKIMVDDAASMLHQQIANEVDDSIYFDIKKIKLLTNAKSYLYQWLSEYGFTAWQDIYDLLDCQSGKQVFSMDYRLCKDRNFLILSPIKIIDNKHYFIDKNQEIVNFPLNLTLSRVNEVSIVSKDIIFVDADKLVFPLTVKKWQEGDSFRPFGMNGNNKKVSKFFKDEKFSILDKHNTWLLWSDNQLIWIIGYRQDERFRVTTTTQNILQIKLEI